MFYRESVLKQSKPQKFNIYCPSFSREHVSLFLSSSKRLPNLFLSLLAFVSFMGYFFPKFHTYFSDEHLRGIRWFQRQTYQEENSIDRRKSAKTRSEDSDNTTTRILGLCECNNGFYHKRKFPIRTTPTSNICLYKNYLGGTTFCEPCDKSFYALLAAKSIYVS